MNNKLKPRFKYKGLYLLFILIILIGVGYALVQTTLTINGSTTIKRNWNLTLENIRKTANSVDVTFSDTTLDSTNGVFSLIISNAQITSEDDCIEFEFDIENKGEIDVSLKDFNIIISEEDYRKYFITSIIYSDGTELNVNDKILSKEKKSFIGKVVLNRNNPEVDLTELLEYNSNIEDISINYKFNITYEQA